MTALKMAKKWKYEWRQAALKVISMAWCNV